MMNPDTLPDFPLASWELPPDSTEPLVAPATMPWHGTLFGRETDWLVRVVKEDHLGRVFICPADSLQEAKWEAGVPMPIRGLHTQEDWSKAINDYIQIWGSLCRRTIYFSDEVAEWILRIEADGSSELTAQYTLEIGDNATVEMNWPFDFVCASAKQIHDKVLRALDDESSDLNFARRWLFLSEDEKYELLVSWKRGDGRDFTKMMQGVADAFGPSLAEEWHQWIFNPASGRFGWVNVQQGFNFEEKFPVEFKIWGEALERFFEPHWNEQYVRDRFIRVSNYYRATIKERTAHEQLEAARELSDWLDEREARGELDAPTLARLRDTLR